MSPVIFYLLIILSSKLLNDFWVNMLERDPIVIFIGVSSIMTPHLELFGLKISCLLNIFKPLWESWTFSNGFGTKHQIISSISVVIMAYLLKISFKIIVRIKVNLRVFMVLKHSKIIPNLRGILKLLWICPEHWWCMFQLIVQIV